MHPMLGECCTTMCNTSLQFLFTWADSRAPRFLPAGRQHYHDKRHGAIVALDRMNYTFDTNVAYVSVHPVAKIITEMRSQSTFACCTDRFSVPSPLFSIRNAIFHRTYCDSYGDRPAPSMHLHVMMTENSQVAGSFDCETCSGT